MIAFLLSSGFTATHIALARIISVAFEISATWLAPFATRKIGPIRAGLWFINWQALWVTIAGLLFVKINSPFLSALGLVGGRHCEPCRSLGIRSLCSGYHPRGALSLPQDLA